MARGSGARIPLLGRRRRPAGSDYKVLFVCSSGGHLAQLLALRGWWEDHPRTWVTFDTPDAVDSLAGERVVHCFHPTTRSVANLLRNLLLAIGTLRSERPDVVISDGAGVAVPFFWLSRVYGASTVYLEVYDRIDSATMTGRLVRPVADLFLVQWERQLESYPGAVVCGPVY